MTTRLAPDRYLALLAADGGRLADAAEGRLQAPVPTCPGWSVADLVGHTGSVYHHKIACTELGRRPEEGEWSLAPDDPDQLLPWYRDALGSLLALLESSGPDRPSYTWYPPEQTTGFWMRRMAQEAAIHRVDSEAAADDITPVDDDLAVDGIDEVLDLFLRFDFTEDPASDPDLDVRRHDGRSVLVRTGPLAWHVSVASGAPDGQVVLRRGAGAAQASVSGEPSELLLWLWGRRPDPAVHIEGDPAATVALRELLALTTQ